MKNKLTSIVAAVAIAATSTLTAQVVKPEGIQVPDHRTCGTMDHHEYLKQTRPNYDAEYKAYNEMLDNWVATNRDVANTQATITIPVVIHVIYRTATENISDAQAISQFSVLNNDFQRHNSDTAVGSAFYSVAGGVNFQFCLATRDPNGNPTTGVVHKSTTTTSFTTNDNVKHASTGGDDAWDVTKYMNIWVCNLGSTLLGYGEFPTSSLSNTYGLVLNYTCTGTTGTATAPYNGGRTGTHEFGHCFNLLHIWGDDNGACTGSDQCSDTPNQAAENYGCPSLPHTDACTTTSPGVMCMNYMDYVDDACMVMFSKQQCARMLAVVSTSPWNVLQSSNGCTPVNSLDAGIASIMNPTAGTSTCSNSVIPKVVLTNGGSTTLTSATITYKMDAGSNQTYNWSGSLATNASTTVTLNSFSGLSSAAHTFSATVSSPNGGTDGYSGNNTLTSTFTVTAAPSPAALPLTEGFEGTTFVPTGWSYNPPNAAAQWARDNGTQFGGFGNSSSRAKMDNYSSTTTIAGQRDGMITPALDLSTANSTLNLTFDVAYAPYSATYTDSLNVWISTDCGGTWTKLYNKGYATLPTAPTTTVSFVPTTSQWRTETVSLSSYAGSGSAYFKFENVSGWGNNLYLDNINISYTPTAQPPVAAFTAAATKCSGQSIAFTDASTNTPTSWAWSTSPSTGVTITSASSQNPTMTFSNAGTYTVSLVATNGSGSSSPSTQTITVNATPSMTSATTKSICSGSSVGLALTSSAASSYSWIAASNANVTGESTTAQTGSTISNTLTTTGTTNQTVTYSVTPTATTGGCVGAAQTVSVTVKPTPSMTSATTKSVCSGNAVGIALTSNVASSYSWVAANNASVTGESTTAQTGATITNTLSISGSTAQNVTYSVTPTSTSGSCAGTTQTVTVTVNPTPSMTSATTSSICSGTAVGLALTSSVASSYSWVAANSANVSGESTTAQTGSTITNTLSTTSTSAQTVTYSVTPTATTGGCAGAVQTVTVTVNPAPTMTSANTVAICSGSSVNLALTCNMPSSFSWVAVNNGNVTGESTTAQTTSTITNTLSITGSTPRTVTYSVTPTATSGSCPGTVQTVSVTVNPKPTVTATANPTNATVCSGSSITLSGGGASTYSWTGGITNGVAFTPVASGTYTVTGSNTYGCTGTATKSVTVNASPTVSVASSPVNPAVCQGTNVTLTASGASTYSWTGGITNGTAFTPSSTTTYTVTGTAANGCTNTATQMVTVNPTPNVTVNSPSTCPGTAVNLNAGGASTYSWNTGASGATISVSPTSNTSYTVTGTDANGCVNTAVSNVTMSSAPSVTANSMAICSGQSATLIAGGANNYSWSTGDNTSSTTVTPTTTTTYTVTGTNGPGCSATAIATVTVNAAMTGLSVTANNSNCGNADGSIDVTGQTGGTAPYTYSLDGGTAGSATSFTGLIADVYTVTVVDANGCTFDNTATIADNAGPSALAVTTANSSCGNSNGVISIGSTTGGTAPYSYSIDGTTFGSATSYSVAAGTYTVTTMDANGCSYQIATSVNDNSAIVPTVTQSGLTLTSSSANTYQWYLDGSPINGETNQTITVTQNGSYTVETTDANGCTSVSSAIVVTSVSIKAEAASGVFLNVYPNPNEGDFVIKANLDINKKYQLKVSNVLGQIVYDERIDNTISYTREVSVKKYDAGVYFVILTTPGETATVHKVVVQ